MVANLKPASGALPVAVALDTRSLVTSEPVMPKVPAQKVAIGGGSLVPTPRVSAVLGRVLGTLDDAAASGVAPRALPSASALSARGQALRLLQDGEQPVLLPVDEGQQRATTPEVPRSIADAFEHFAAQRPQAFVGLDAAQNAYARGAMVLLIGAVQAGELAVTDVPAALQLIAAVAAQHGQANVTSAPLTGALVTRPIAPPTRPDEGNAQIEQAQRNAQGLPMPDGALAANEWYYSRGNAEDAALRFQQLTRVLQVSRAGDYVVELQRADGTWYQLNASAHARDGTYYSLLRGDGMDVPLPVDSRGWPLLPNVEFNELTSIENADIGDIHVARGVAPSERARSRAQNEPSISNLVHGAAIGLDGSSGIKQLEAQLASVLADPKSVAHAITSFNARAHTLRRIDDAVNQFRLAQEPPDGISRSDLALLGWEPPPYGLVLARRHEGDVEAFAIKRDNEDVPRLYDAKGQSVAPNWREYREATFAPTYDTPTVALPEASNQESLQAVRDAYRSLPPAQRSLRERVVRDVSEAAKLTLAQQSLYHSIANVQEPVELAVRSTREKERLAALLDALQPLGVRTVDDIAPDFDARVSAGGPKPVVDPTVISAAQQRRLDAEAAFASLPFPERMSRTLAAADVQREADLNPYKAKLYRLLYVYDIPPEVVEQTEPAIAHAVGENLLHQSLSRCLGLENEEAIRADFAARVARREE
jgi:hypothetical protein